MIFSAGIVLAIASLAVEGVIVWYIPRLHNYYISTNFGAILNIFNSVMLSIVLGKAFGATGLAVMLGAMVSTAASALGFHRMTYLAKQHAPEIARGWDQIKGQLTRLAKNLTNFVRFCLAIPIAIGRMYGWTVRTITQAKTFGSQMRKGLTRS